MHSDCGQVDRAFQVVDEALSITNALVEKRGGPTETMLLATLYNTKGNVERTANQLTKSLLSCEAAISTLAPVFRTNPNVYGLRMKVFLRNYEVTRQAGSFSESEFVRSMKSQVDPASA
jgi:hypothetical protein